MLVLDVFRRRTSRLSALLCPPCWSDGGGDASVPRGEDGVLYRCPVCKHEWAETVPISGHAQEEDSSRSRTVGELLTSIAHLIDTGELHTALDQARGCAEMYGDIPLPDRPAPEGH